MEVHRRLGCGFLEAVYTESLVIEFLERRIPFETEHTWPIVYRDITLPLRYRVDFFCFGAVIVEVKAIAELGRLERSQTVNYVRMARAERGLLLNFGGASLQYRRIVSRWLAPDLKSSDH